jgi:formylglycine-generating enzyme required for sulfatase activity
MASTAIIERSEALRAELVSARQQTDSLFRLISPGSLYERPIPERHRLIFYLGHFEAFDWNVLARYGLGQPSFHAEFDRLFERGIDPPPGQARQDSPHDWPSQTEVEQYGAKTRDWIDSHWNGLNPWLQQLVIEHRHMHAETFAYLLHALPYDRKISLSEEPRAQRPAPPNPMIPIAAGTATLGKSRDSFGWDNEHLAHRISGPAFRISKFKVSNGEYLDFVRQGGRAPHFWTLAHGQWFYRGMFAQMPLPLDWPVWVTWQQASAYAQWRGLALPTEAQFHRAAALSPPDPLRDNFGYHRWDPIAVDAGHEKADAGAPVQMTGNGWEWTRDVFAPFSGFEADPAYPAYSADFFDGEHYVMKGASPRTAPILTRPSFRNWFRPDYPYIYAGFRVVDTESAGN